MANEPRDGTAETLTDQPGVATSPPKLSVLILSLAAILTFFGAVGLVLYLKPGGDSPAPAIFVAGPLEGFEPGSATYFETEHLYVVRLTDGALLALYDLGPRMQALLQETGDKDWLRCRAEFVPDNFDLTALGTPPAGFEERVFREPCHGSTWDANGNRLFGPTTGSLDRFPVRVVDGSVHVDVSNRRCMNPVSEVAPCSPTQ
ncbi:MAG TPA: hypothetical protein VG845_06040 [Dehalococcoidia bacterium]|jgi:nitrite reductase/ring-hydroxylating ferredoxin subunit|nr:hypothetical protein [Dehalococcoidia bacterium]